MGTGGNREVNLTKGEGIERTSRERAPGVRGSVNNGRWQQRSS